MSIIQSVLHKLNYGVDSFLDVTFGAKMHAYECNDYDYSMCSLHSEVPRLNFSIASFPTLTAGCSGGVVFCPGKS